MDTSPSEWVQEGFTELAEEIRALAVKHNYLVESITLLWVEVQRTTADPITKQICQRRIEELTLMLHEVDRKPENPTSSSDQTAWD